MKNGYHEPVAGVPGWTCCLVARQRCPGCDRPCRQERDRRQAAELTAGLVAQFAEADRVAASKA